MKQAKTQTGRQRPLPPQSNPSRCGPIASPGKKAHSKLEMVWMESSELLLFSCQQQTIGRAIWEIECFYAAYEDYLLGAGHISHSPKNVPGLVVECAALS
jgi:hypothetical protein